MSEAADTLAKQIEEWESKVHAARETVRIGASILPHLREALSAEMGGGEQKEDQQGAGRKQDSQTQPDDGVGATTLTSLRKADEVQAAVEDVLDDVPDKFDQGDVDAALQARRQTVNRSTLRQNMLLMAQSEVLFRVAVPGKGRKATIFEKTGAAVF